MISFVNDCVFRAVSSGLGDFVVSAAITGHVAPAAAVSPAMVGGGTFHYRAMSDDGSQVERGEGVWTAGSSTLSRATIFSSTNANAKVNFSAAPKVALVALAQDVVSGKWEVIGDTIVSSPVAEVRHTFGPSPYYSFRQVIISMTAADPAATGGYGFVAGFCDPAVTSTNLLNASGPLSGSNPAKNADGTSSAWPSGPASSISYQSLEFWIDAAQGTAGVSGNSSTGSTGPGSPNLGAAVLPLTSLSSLFFGIDNAVGGAAIQNITAGRFITLGLRK